MSRPKAIQLVRPDRVAVICAWHSDKEEGDQWAENNGYDITHAICPDCIDKYKADSIKGTSLEIKV